MGGGRGASTAWATENGDTVGFGPTPPAIVGNRAFAQSRNRLALAVIVQAFTSLRCSVRQQLAPTAMAGETACSDN